MPPSPISRDPAQGTKIPASLPLGPGASGPAPKRASDVRQLAKRPGCDERGHARLSSTSSFMPPCEPSSVRVPRLSQQPESAPAAFRRPRRWLTASDISQSTAPASPIAAQTARGWATTARLPHDGERWSKLARCKRKALVVRQCVDGSKKLLQLRIQMRPIVWVSVSSIALVSFIDECDDVVL